MSKQPSVAVVIPCYRVETEIENVIRSLPDWIDYIIAVDDASTDNTQSVLLKLRENITRLTVLFHDKNKGVGGAMVTGFKEAKRLNADYVVKLDGDGQMDANELPRLLAPLIEERADYAKGNRFVHTEQLAAMPKLRLVGNICLTFLNKLISGYWHIFDAQNGYLAITGDALNSINLNRVDNSYCFENSMLSNLNMHDKKVIDVPMPAIYGKEQSNLVITNTIRTFPFKFFRMFLRRIVFKYLIYDVSPISIYLFLGTLLFAFSLLFGGYHWWRSIATGVPATTGTVVLALLPFLMGFSLFLQAIDLDIRNSPKPEEPKRKVDPSDVADYFSKK